MYIKCFRWYTAELIHLPQDCKWKLVGGLWGTFDVPSLILIVEKNNNKEEYVLFDRDDVETPINLTHETSMFCSAVVGVVTEMLMDESCKVLDMNQIINEQWMKTQKEWLAQGLIERLDQYPYANAPCDWRT